MTFTKGTGSTWDADWDGVSGRTYFLQYSLDLVNWSHAPTMRFGTGVADALRVYSEEFRDKRMQKAEEQAAKMGTKLVFPLVLFMFPIFFIVAVGPAVIRIIDAFSKV